MQRQTRVAIALGAMTSLAAWIGACAPAPQVIADQCPARLTTFDTLDFVAYSGQKWDRFKESHSPDIVVTWPDGRETKGLAQHIEDLKSQFVYAPDTKITEHPIRICSGDWTSVTGVMTGTFSQPMPMPGGKPIPPTGKSFKVSMATIGHWNGSTMDHEWLFWDNHAFMQQVGLAK